MLRVREALPVAGAVTAAACLALLVVGAALAPVHATGASPQVLALPAGAGWPSPAPEPGLVGADWSGYEGASFLSREDRLSADLAVDGSGGAAHLRLARLLLGAGLSFEAIGVLDDALGRSSSLAGQAEPRALRGMAEVMAGRWAAAVADLAAPPLAGEAAPALWRSYALARESQWTLAGEAAEAGAPALAALPPLWRLRFARSAAEAALQAGDLGRAGRWISIALATPSEPAEAARSQLVAARIAEQAGGAGEALSAYAALARAPWDDVAAPAELCATSLRLKGSQIGPVAAAAVFEKLRFRWRGSSFEAENAAALAQLAETEGRYDLALRALRGVAAAPGSPEGLALSAERRRLFQTLFEEGAADRAAPIEALGLYEDGRALVPIGADGDAFARRFARRLAAAGLPNDAEAVLAHQAQDRLLGPARAEVSDDLAELLLGDDKPGQALAALKGSDADAPSALAPRALLETRALAELAWARRDWPAAAALYEALLGDRYVRPGPLAPDEEQSLLRAAAAWSLAGDEAALSRLRSRWGAFAADAPGGLKLALAPARVAPTSGPGQALADDSALEASIGAMQAARF